MAEMDAVKAAVPEVPEAWRKTEVARNPQRLHPMDILDALFTGHQEIHGDRGYGDDAAMYCAMACFGAEPVMVICNRKGRTTKERMKFRFGSPEPEGYRKALRCMKLAEKFGRPVITVLDLAGAYPGLGAEERGQGEAIARNLIEMSTLRVPTLALITGEGGSGGALALAVADRVLMLENAIYSVISPEGCASIMWKDSNKRQQAAEALKYTAPDVLRLGCVDDIVAEPEGGTQADPHAALQIIDAALRRELRAIREMPLEALLDRRYERFRSMAQFYTVEQASALA